MITKHQRYILASLLQGGKIFEFIDTGEVGWDDEDGNTLQFSKATFNSLINKSAIEVKSQPHADVMIYGISDMGFNMLRP